MRPYSLTLHTSVLDPGHGFVRPLTDAAPDWTRQIAAIGGYGPGRFTYTAPDCAAAFNTWLGYHVIEKTAGYTTYEGMITELEYWRQGIRRIRTLEIVANAVRATYGVYTYQPGGSYSWQDWWTDWAVNAQAIAKYGRRELYLELEACPQATAEAKRDVTLAQFAYPWPRAIGSSPSPSGRGVGGEGDRLIVRTSGYLSTARWMFLHEGDYTDHDVSHWIAAIVGADYGLSTNHGGATATAGDCQFLKIGKIDTNTLQVTEATLSPQLAGDILTNLAELGDATGKPWQLQAGPGRQVNYHQLDVTPRYYIRRGAVYDSLTAGVPTPATLIRPAVIRDMSFAPSPRTEPGSFLDNPRDIYVEEVEANAAGQVSLRTALFDKSNLLANQLDYLQDRPRGW